MNGLDLFSGIGGITKALEGYVRPIAYCENDRYAQAVLLSRMSDGSISTAPIWDDVQTLQGEILPPIDIIYGGFPCQDISVAGRGAGLAGERSGLFFEIARLVSEIRPRFVFLENVPAINRRGGITVVGTLADLGYDSRWDVLSAADVGANHRRERWWLLAHSKYGGMAGRRRAFFARKESLEPRRIPELILPSIKSQKTTGLANLDGNRRREGRSRAQVWERGQNFISNGQLMANTKGSKRPRLRTESCRQQSRFANAGWWSIEPNVVRVAHGIPQRVDRLRALGNAVVPAQAREAFERLMGFK